MVEWHSIDFHIIGNKIGVKKSTQQRVETILAQIYHTHSHFVDVANTLPIVHSYRKQKRTDAMEAIRSDLDSNFDNHIPFDSCRSVTNSIFLPLFLLLLRHDFGVVIAADYLFAATFCVSAESV